MSQQLSPSWDANRLATAAREVRDRRAASTQRRLVAAQSRRRLAAVDAVLTLLEDRILEGDVRVDARLHDELCTLEREVGLPLPRRATHARTPARLHAALLDWQETVLDHVLPGRLAFEDVHDSDSDVPSLGPTRGSRSVAVLVSL